MAAVMVGATSVALLSGCDIKHETGDLVHGKTLFASTCGTCHTLAHAGTQAATGPNLDDAFAQDRSDGIDTKAIQGFVSYWIVHPDSGGVMPAGLLQGRDAADVAAYVAHVAAIPGKDTGELANIGAQKVPVTPASGKQVFLGVGGCGSCHVLADAGTHGNTGPDLTARLASDCATAQSKQLRGATLPACIETAIIDPYKYLPSGYKAGIMPSNFKTQLSASQVQALVAYLASVTK